MNNNEDHEVGIQKALSDVNLPPLSHAAAQVITAYFSGTRRRKYVVDWTENGDPILLDQSIGPPHPVIGTHDLPAPVSGTEPEDSGQRGMRDYLAMKRRPSMEVSGPEQPVDPMDKMTAGEMPRLAEWKKAGPDGR